MSLVYSDQTINAFVDGFNEMCLHGHMEMTTGHLLYGLTTTNSIFRPILQGFGITSERVHTALVALLGSSPSTVSPEQYVLVTREQYGLSCDDDAKSAFERAIKAAKWLDQRSFSAFWQSREIATKYCDNGVERIHLFLALLQEGGEIRDILDCLEVSPEELEISIRRLAVTQRIPYPVLKTLEGQGYNIEQLEEHIPKWVESRAALRRPE